MFDQVITLIRDTKRVNEYGDTVIEPSERSVFAELRSIGQTEFYQAQATDLKPVIKFILADYLDYKNETKIMYQGFGEEVAQGYTVIKTYRNGNQLEITCSKGIEK